MNREFYQIRAYHDGVRTAKAANRPLSVWPSEKHLLRIEDLPVLPEEQTPAQRLRFVASDAELRVHAQVGKRYALAQYAPNERGEFLVGEWD